MAVRLNRRSALRIGAAGLLAGQPAPAGRQAHAATPLAMVEVAPGIFVHPGAHEMISPQNLGAIANVGFIVGDDAVAVIDSGGCARGGAHLRAAIRRLTNRPIRYLITSHVHPDHVFGHAAFEGDAPLVIGHAKLPAALAMRGAFYLDNLRQTLGPLAAGTKIVPPTETVADWTEIDLGGRRLELLAHPTAHTDNDLSVFDVATGTLWLADLLFMERIPVIDGSLLGWLDVLAALHPVSAARVVPGHGPPSAAWPDGVADQVAYLTRLRDEVREVIGRGDTLEQAVATVGGERTAWRLFDAYHARNVTAAYAELEWE